ncbi:MAG: N-acetyl sugar amidotransferase [Flavobacteriia bacterium]
MIQQPVPYQLCNRCVMDTSDPGIYFDENGNCNHCTEFLNKRANYSYKGLESDLALEKIVRVIKDNGVGKAYDCIVGLSGGVDSSYTAWKAKEMGLRLLGVHLDNCWNSIEANQNIRNIASKLNIDYECVVLDWQEFKQIQAAFLRASIPEADTPTDIAILAILHKMASKHGVKYILSGGNFATEGILPKHWHYNAKDLRYFKHICSNFGPVKLRSFPTFGFVKEAYYKIFKGIRMIYFLNYLSFDKTESISLLKEKLDWKEYGGKHYESKYTGFIQSYYLYNKFNIDYRRATLSSQICAGTVRREDALEALKNKPYSENRVSIEMKYIAKKLDFSEEKFNALLMDKPYWYTRYPNDEKRLNWIYNWYRKLFKKEKLASF